MGKSVFGREDRKPLVKNIVVGIIGAALCVWGDCGVVRRSQWGQAGNRSGFLPCV